MDLTNLAASQRQDDARTKVLRLGVEDVKVEPHFDARRKFPKFCFSATAPLDVSGIKPDYLHVVRASNADGTFVLEFLADDHKMIHSKNFLAANDRV